MTSERGTAIAGTHDNVQHPDEEWSLFSELDIDLENEKTPQLGIKNSDTARRVLITRDNIGDTSFAATLQHVQYGTNGGNDACLIVIDFTFRFTGKKLSRYSSAKIEVKLSKAVDVCNHKVASHDPEQDPKVVNLAPKEVYGVVRTVEGKTYREVSIPVMFESPLGLSAGVETKFGSEKTEQLEHRTEIHGDLYWDDDHIEAASGASWDLRENEAQRDGIFRHFRAALIVEHPHGSPMWMHVVVEPSVKFSLNPARLFTKSDVVARLFQRNDHPFLLDGKAGRGTPVGSGLEFSSAQFPWSKVVWMPSEHSSQLLAQATEDAQNQQSGSARLRVANE